jgi:hypothetical protein
MMRIARYRKQEASGDQTASGTGAGGSGGNDEDVVDADFNEG